MDRVRTTDRLHTGLGKTKVDYLTRANQFFHGVSHFFNRHCRIDTVLVEEVDGVDLQSLE